MKSNRDAHKKKKNSVPFPHVRNYEPTLLSHKLISVEPLQQPYWISPPEEMAKALRKPNEI